MSDPIREQISAFLDGELPEGETELLLKRLTRDPDLRENFGRYSLIGEAIRGGSAGKGVSRDFAARISRSVDPGPTISVPVSLPAAERSWWRPLAGIALAAGVAAIAVTALEWRADAPARIAANAPSISGSARPAASVVASTIRTSAASGAGSTAPEALSYTVPAASADAPAVLSPSRLASYVFAHSRYSSPLGQRNMISGLISEPPAAATAEPAPSIATSRHDTP